MNQISVVSVPGTGLYTNETKIGKQAVYSVDKQRTAELLNQYFRPYEEAVPAESLGIIELTEYPSEENHISTFDQLNGAEQSVASDSGE